MTKIEPCKCLNVEVAVETYLDDTVAYDGFTISCPYCIREVAGKTIEEVTAAWNEMQRKDSK